MKQNILSHIPAEHPWKDLLVFCDRIPSTNDLAKKLAKEGAAEGTVVIAAEQTAGRGRMGRSFHAPAGLGLYFSVILRPERPAEELLHLTCAAAEAACDAVEECSANRPRIKWINDLVMGNKKLGGILTELSVNSKTGLVDWAVIGIGINCCHRLEDFPHELQDIATSLLLSTGKAIQAEHLAGCLIQAFYRLNKTLLTEKDTIMNRYRLDCMTVGREIVLIRGEEKRYGTALQVEDDGGLRVLFDDGTTQTVQSGEVSVRGLYGYI